MDIPELVNISEVTEAVNNHSGVTRVLVSKEHYFILARESKSILGDAPAPTSVMGVPIVVDEKIDGRFSLEIEYF